MSFNNAEDNIIFCPRCGRKNPNVARFCTGCSRQMPRLEGKAVPPMQDNNLPSTASGHIDTIDVRPQNPAFVDRISKPFNPSPTNSQRGPHGRPLCRRCGTESTLIGRIAFDESMGLCPNCKEQVRIELYNAFYTWCPFGIMSEQSLQWLGYYAAERGVDISKAISLIRADASARLRSVLAAAYDDPNIILTEHDFSNIPLTIETLGITFSDKRFIERQILGLSPLMPPRTGNLPVYTITHIYLESDEVCHLAVRTTTYKETKDNKIRMTGEFIATNKRLLHRGPEGSIEIPWKNIMRVTRNRNMVHLELTSKRGAGFYEVDDPVYVANLLRILVLMWKRQIVFQRASSGSRHIPQNVKTAVWQRDGGACVQCGATDYLEFDHIIPHSRGGANTINNVQLLCRKCNADKSDRI